MQRSTWLAVLVLEAIGAGIACGSSSEIARTEPTVDAAPTTTLPDARLPEPDAQPVDAGAKDTSVPPPTDAAPEASVDAAPPGPTLAGIWQGTATQTGIDPFTVLLTVHPTALTGAPGAVVGLMTYPSLGCGGYLTRLDAAGDAGAIDAAAPAVGLRLLAHERVLPEVACIIEGDDLLTLLPDGRMLYEYWGDYQGQQYYATGTLSRVGVAGPAEALSGTWAEPTAAPNGVRPLMASLVRTDAIGQPAGLFLRASDDGAYACGGVWTLRGRTSASDLLVEESFPAGDMGCTGAPLGGARLLGVGTQLQHTRATDAGPGPTLTLDLGGR